MTYRIEFEIVHPRAGGGLFYAGERPVCKPSDVADEYWTKANRTTDDPWDQYNQLRAWAASGEQLVRNVKLFSSEPQHWKEVPQ